jgi:hypothetical protein
MPACLLLLSLALEADVDRSIGKEPKYDGKPRYALLLIGKEQKRIWLVQDGDTLYADTNGDLKPAKGKRDRVTRHEAVWAPCRRTYRYPPAM